MPSGPFEADVAGVANTSTAAGTATPSSGPRMVGRTAGPRVRRSATRWRSAGATVRRSAGPWVRRSAAGWRPAGRRFGVRLDRRLELGGREGSALGGGDGSALGGDGCVLGATMVLLSGVGSARHGCRRQDGGERQDDLSDGQEPACPPAPARSIARARVLPLTTPRGSRAFART